MQPNLAKHWCTYIKIIFILGHHMAINVSSFIFLHKLQTRLNKLDCLFNLKPFFGNLFTLRPLPFSDSGHLLILGGGTHSGMSTIVVTPPAAAALVAVQKPSQEVRPGSFTCTWQSTMPGITRLSPTSNTCHHS